jgi:MOSC domain-containing protein YiiM
MMSVPEVLALPGRGLEGDRYFVEEGTWSDHPAGDNQLTLIEKEAIEAIERDGGIKIDPGDARRNLVTEGVALNHLVGQEFKIGSVLVKGLRLCEPCRHLEELTKPGLRKALIHRGGLRAEILSEGTVRVGDAVDA